MDNERFQPPPERDVSPQLRARVLHRALDSTSPSQPRRRRLTGPVLAGLSAAAVVIGIIAFLGADHQAHKPVGPSGGPTGTPRLVHAHDAVAVDIRQLSPGETTTTHEACLDREPQTTVGQVRANRLQRSPLGRIPILAYSNVKARPQYLCTPYDLTSTGPESLVTSGSTPIISLLRSRVQVRVETDDGTGDEWYIDGCWFSAASSVGSIEVRIDVGDDAGRWYSTKRVGNMMFAPAWRRLSPDQVDQPVTVEYRAISVDGSLITVPDLRSTVVVPKDVAVNTPIIPDSPGFGPRAL